MNLSSYYRKNFSSFLRFICYYKAYIYKPFRRSISSYLLIITSFSCRSYFLLPRFPRKRMLKDHVLSMKISISRKELWKKSWDSGRVISICDALCKPAHLECVTEVTYREENVEQNLTYGDRRSNFFPKYLRCSFKRIFRVPYKSQKLIFYYVVTWNICE